MTVTSLHNIDYDFTIQEYGNASELNIVFEGEIKNPDEIINMLDLVPNHDSHYELYELNELFAEYFDEAYTYLIGEHTNLISLEQCGDNLYHYEVSINSQGSFSEMKNILDDFRENFHSADYDFWL